MADANRQDQSDPTSSCGNANLLGVDVCATSTARPKSTTSPDQPTSKMSSTDFDPSVMTTSDITSDRMTTTTAATVNPFTPITTTASTSEPPALGTATATTTEQTTTMAVPATENKTNRSNIASADSLTFESRPFSHTQISCLSSTIVTLSVSDSATPSTPAGGNTSSSPATRTIAIVAGIVGTGLFLCAVLLCARCILPRNAPIRRFFIGRTQRRRGELGSHANPNQLESNGEVNEVSISRLGQPIVQMKSTETGLKAIPRTAPISLLSEKARSAQQLEREANVQPVARPAGLVSQDISTQQPIVGVAVTLDSSAQRMSTVLEEIQNMRTQVHELMCHQQQEASQNFPSTSSDVDDGRIAPPSYSEAGAC